MRSLLITLAAGAMTLLLSGCPDMPGGPVPAAQSDAHWKSSRAMRAPHDNVTRAPGESAAAHGTGVHHAVSEIAWFQGTIDEAFSRHGCLHGRQRRGLFHS